MDKQTVLKAFYLSKITELLEQCGNVTTLDLIYRLLEEDAKQ